MNLNRRDFLKVAGGAAAIGIASSLGLPAAHGISPIRYPRPLRRGDTIGITAPSAGVGPELAPRMVFCLAKLRSLGYQVRLGDCLWSDRMASAPPEERAAELEAMLCDDAIDAVMPPWGGEILIGILPLLDWDRLARARPKWIVGYSDLSTFMLAYTLRTRIATLNGSNLLEAPIDPPAPGLAHWNDVTTLAPGASFVQCAAARYQDADVDWAKNPSVTHFAMTAPVAYKCLGHEQDPAYTMTATGRLLGGTLDVIAMLAGSAYGDVPAFARISAPEGLLIFLDNCDMNTAQYCRLLHHLKLAGWFEAANAILVGRTGGEQLREFTQRDALLDALGTLAIPVIYDMDIGHLPPQMMLVNGARATMHFGPGAKSTCDFYDDATSNDQVVRAYCWIRQTLA
jgi:muramoyltetrapeptide carboxypeptidase LdcA involved in peptidoglycan recycling